MAFELALQRLYEYKRLVANDCIICEEGVFAPNELPDDYAGSFEGTLQVVYAVVHIDAVGRLRYSTYNPPPLLNKDRKSGLLLNMSIETPSGVTVTVPVSGTGIGADEEELTPVVALDWVYNPDMPEHLRRSAYIAWMSLVSQIPSWNSE